MDFNHFDISTKELVWDDPAAWLEGFGIGPRGPVEVIDSDITTLSAAADKVIRVGGAEPYLVNIELQSSHETTLPARSGIVRSRLTTATICPCSPSWSCSARRRTRPASRGVTTDTCRTAD